MERRKSINDLQRQHKRITSGLFMMGDNLKNMMRAFRADDILNRYGGNIMRRYGTGVSWDTPLPRSAYMGNDFIRAADEHRASLREENLRQRVIQYNQRTQGGGGGSQGNAAT